jgi:DNA-binding NarL/FixJ family response regulator
MRLAGVPPAGYPAPKVWIPAPTGTAPGGTIPLMSPTVLIVDDHPAFRASARRLLGRHDYDVVGEAADGREALAVAETVRPDVVLLDVGLPDIDGLEVARRLGEDQPTAAVVLVSSRDGDDLGPLLEGVGARGFIPKAELSAAAIEKLLG